MTNGTIRTAPCLVGAMVLVLAASARAQIATYQDEAVYLSALAALGAGTVQEGFEDAGTWGAARFPSKAASVTSQGIRWTANNLTSRITTSAGAARTGNWGGFTLPHGITTGNPTDLQRDGFIGTLTAGGTLIGVGGWLTSNTPGAEVRFALDGTAATFADPVLLFDYKFFGAIDPAGFTAFEVFEVQGTVEDQKLIFADDFTLGVSGTGGTPTQTVTHTPTATNTPTVADTPTATPTSTPTRKATSPGDADCNERLDVRDVAATVTAIFDPIARALCDADCNQDDTVTSADVTCVVKLLAGPQR